MESFINGFYLFKLIKMAENLQDKLSDKRFERINKYITDAFNRYKFDEEKIRRYFGRSCPATKQEREAYCNRLLNLPNYVRDMILNINSLE